MICYFHKKHEMVGDVRVRMMGAFLIDAEDYETVRLHRWHRDSDGYIWRHHRDPSGKYTTRKLHRELVGAPAGMSVDHINGNKLDNRRCNLRICSHRDNMRNHKRHKRNTTGFTGVRRMGNRWHARLGGVHLGAFPTAEDARLARVEAEKKHWGCFAPSSNLGDKA